MDDRFWKYLPSLLHQSHSTFFFIFFRYLYYLDTLSMDFIRYQPAIDNQVIDDSSSDENMDFEGAAFQYGEIETLVDIDTMPDNQGTEMEEDIEELIVDIKTVTIDDGKRQNKKYGPDQIERFIRIMQEEGLTVPQASQACGIPRSSAYKLLNEFNKSDGSTLPGTALRKVNRPQKKIHQQHTDFLIKLFDNEPSTTIEQAKQELCTSFEGFTISLSALHEHIKKKCMLTLKQAQKYTMERDAPRTIALRFDIITQWKAEGVNFMQNCVFVDESGFHSQMIRNRAWSKRNTPATAKVPTQKGVNISIVGCTVSPHLEPLTSLKWNR
jgi:hypothetical protein